MEDDSIIHKDLVKILNKLLSLNTKYEHSYEVDVNNTAYLKSNLLGNFANILIEMVNWFYVLGKIFFYRNF